jgi:acyl-CoA dehydrogenase
VSAAEALAKFVRDNVAARGLELIQSEAFPWSLWHEMGAQGWLGFGMAAHGGLEASSAELFDTAMGLANAAEVVGFCNAWMVHHTVAGKVVGEYADDEQAARWMPELAAGRSSACIAISEPGAGAHPKRLTTRAEKVDGGWRLTGEKAWLTNGPIADVFVVVAITDEIGGRKRFGAFLVPSETEGVEKTAGVRIDFARPAGHGGLKLDGAFLPDSSYMHRAGDAVETVLKRFRRVEDMIGLATKAGIMSVQLRHLARLLDNDSSEVLGGLDADRELYASAARQLMADSGGDPASPEHEARLLALRRLGRKWQAAFSELHQTVNGQDPFLDLLARDVSKLSQVAERVDQAKLVKRGGKLLAGGSPA